MAQLAADAPDRRVAGWTGQFTALNNVSAWVALRDFFHMAAGPTGVGTVALEVSFDGGTTAHVCSLPDGTPNNWAVPIALTPEAPREQDVLYRLRCTSFSSGPIPVRLSQ